MRYRLKIRKNFILIVYAPLMLLHTIFSTRLSASLFTKSATDAFYTVKAHPTDPYVFATLQETHDTIEISVYKIDPESLIVGDPLYTQSYAPLRCATLAWHNNGAFLSVKGYNTLVAETISSYDIKQWCQQYYSHLIDQNVLKIATKVFEYLPPTVSVPPAAEYKEIMKPCEIALQKYEADHGKLQLQDTLYVTWIYTCTIRAFTTTTLLYQYTSQSFSAVSSWSNGLLPEIDTTKYPCPGIQKYIQERRQELTITKNEIQNNAHLTYATLLEPQYRNTDQLWYALSDEGCTPIAAIAGPRGRDIPGAQLFQCGCEDGNPYILYYREDQGLALDRYEHYRWYTKNICSPPDLMNLYEKNSEILIHPALSDSSTLPILIGLAKIPYHDAYLVCLAQEEELQIFLVQGSGKGIQTRRIDILIPKIDPLLGESVWINLQPTANGTLLLGVRSMGHFQILYAEIQRLFATGKGQ